MAVGDLGQMLTYKAGNRLVDGADFAIDNGVVKLVDRRPITDPDWSESAWLRCLDRYADSPDCLFAVVPDVVGDAPATDDRWHRYAGQVIDRGYSPAYVLQNGCESIPDAAGAVFVGGDTRWKLGAQASRLVAQAKAKGLWAHCGRVNSLRRLRIAADMGCDSADGTLLAHGPDVRLPQLLGWLHPVQPGLFGGVA